MSSLLSSAVLVGNTAVFPSSISPFSISLPLSRLPSCVRWFSSVGPYHLGRMCFSSIQGPSSKTVSTFPIIRPMSRSCAIISFIGCVPSISATFTYPCHILRRSYVFLLEYRLFIDFPPPEISTMVSPGGHMSRSGDCAMMMRRVLLSWPEISRCL